GRPVWDRVRGLGQQRTRVGYRRLISLLANGAYVVRVVGDVDDVSAGARIIYRDGRYVAGVVSGVAESKAGDQPLTTGRQRQRVILHVVVGVLTEGPREGRQAGQILVDLVERRVLVLVRHTAHFFLRVGDVGGNARQDGLKRSAVRQIGHVADAE